MAVRPAGNDRGTSRSKYCIVGTKSSRRIVKSSCINESASEDPELSPVKTIDEAGTASWNDPGGGAIKDRYAWNTSTRAAGKGF